MGNKKTHTEEYNRERKECQIAWKKEYRQEHREHRKEYQDKYRQEHEGEYHKYNRKYGERLKAKVFSLICGGNPCCSRCGCSDIRFLEVNHKNGGGSKERRKAVLRGTTLYWDIFKGKRKTDDLEILCSPCNAVHYLELKYGKLPYKVIYRE